MVPAVLIVQSVRERKTSRKMGGQRRQALADITHGRHAALMRTMTCEETDFEVPVVDPAELSLPGEKKAIPFTVSQMVSLGEMRGTNDQWAKLVQTLGDREGTVVDITEDIMGYHDQASLTEAKQGPVMLEAPDVFAALRGQASWPTLIRVECWLRDVIQVEQIARHRVAALKLWSICIAMVGGPEALREVVGATTDFVRYDIKEAQCSGRGSDMVATVAWKRAMLYNEWLWTGVMMSVERMSRDVLWDWRKVDRSCYTHVKLDCAVVGERELDRVEVPHPDRLAGGYSGNMKSAFDVTCGCGCGALEDECLLDIDSDPEGEEKIDFSI